MESTKKDTALGIILVGLAIAIVLGILWTLLFGWQYFKVWRAEKTGQAEFVQAEQNRRIKVLESQASLESATLQAQAEVERAKGVKEANAIIAEGLGGPEGYLRYLYINTLNDLETQLIYVPTEAGLPILEAGKR